MVLRAEPTAAQWTPLTRDRIVGAAVRYIDAHGLGGLSMHKLGAELGVKAMSLYNHVTNKHDLLDGVVEQLWAEIESAAPAVSDWRAGFRSLAYALRDAFHRHPNAAALITSHGIMPALALRCIQAHIAAATARGVPEASAYATLRTVTSYALGIAVNEVSWSQEGYRPATVGEMLRPDVTPELARVAEIFCGQSDPEQEFNMGLDLMLRSTGTPDCGPGLP